MGNLHFRQRELLKYLLQSDDFQPVKRLAQTLFCSDKTVRTDLARLEDWGIPIEKVAGRGIRIAANKKHLVGGALHEKHACELSTQQRRMKILFDLLDGSKPRLSIQTLSDTYFVSKTSIVNDLRVIENKLARYQLHLRKDVQGTKLVGEESDIRRALVDMLSQMVTANVSTPGESFSRIDQDTLLELENHFGKARVREVEAILERGEEFLRYRIAEPYYINLITHILILIDRIQKDRMLYADDQVPSGGSAQFYEASRRIAADIEAAFGVRFNEAEIFYLYRYLTSSGGVAVQAMESPHDDAQARAFAEEIIQTFRQIFPMALSFNPTLYRAMLLHIRPMLNRVQYEINIKNPLLDEMWEEFPEVMTLLRLAAAKLELERGLHPISSDEIAYLAVYFQSAIEEAVHQKSVMIVCSSGVGTSHLLEKRVKKHFPEWNIVGIVSVKQLEQSSLLASADLVLATVHLPTPPDKPVAYVSVLFNKEDERRIRASFMQRAAYVEDAPNLPMRPLPEGKAVKLLLRADFTAALALHVYQGERERPEVTVTQPALGKERRAQTVCVTLRAASDWSVPTMKMLYAWIAKNLEHGGNEEYGDF